MKENKPKPACYAVFEEDQSIRIWGNHPILIEGLRKKFGDRLRPLYITPQPDPSVSALVEVLLKARSAVATLAGIRSAGVYEGDEEHARELYALLGEIDALATYRNQGSEQ